MRPIIDTRNTFAYHLVIGSASVFLVAITNLSGIDLNRATAAVAFLLLAVTLSIGPLTRILDLGSGKLPWTFPWGWRGEFGIWFVIMSLAHTGIVFHRRDWDIIGFFETLRPADLAALIGLFLILILAATSFSRVIGYIGMASWRWIHRFAHVAFFLLALHVINHSFLRPGRPEDWLHWSYLLIIIIVIGLQFVEFGSMVARYRRRVGK